MGIDEPPVVRVLITDDQAIVRTGVRMLLEREVDIRVVGEASTQSEALELATQSSPDLILLNLEMFQVDGLALLPELAEAGRPGRVLVLTGVRDLEVHRAAIRAGALGLVLKSSQPEMLVKAIRKVAEGEAWFDRRLMGQALTEIGQGQNSSPDEDEVAEKIARLTKREHDVILLVAGALKNRGIGERLFISEATVRHHLTSIYEKLGVSDRCELIVFAYTNGLVPRASSANA
jgi:DNA-binding NarL/FixJ family response regulator